MSIAKRLTVGMGILFLEIISYSQKTSADVELVQGDIQPNGGQDKMEFRGGLGGYGGVNSMNQDGRASKYAPHISISKYTDYVEDEIVVSCRDCGLDWRHPRGKVQNVPQECAKLEWEGRSSDKGTDYSRRWSSD